MKTLCVIAVAALFAVSGATSFLLMCACPIPGALLFAGVLASAADAAKLLAR